MSGPRIAQDATGRSSSALPSGEPGMGARRAPSAAAVPFPLTVLAVEDLGPRLRRITLGGVSLLRFATDDGATWDLRVKVLVPSPGHTLPPADVFAPKGWRQAWLGLPENARGHLRSYTVREARLEEAYPEIDIDFVLHPHGPQGPAAQWARTAAPGDQALVLGPATRPGSPEQAGVEFAPGAARHVLLAGDETALPAIAGILRDLPAGATAQAIIEVPDGHLVRGMPTGADAAIEWLVRGTAPHGERLTEAVRRAVPAPLRSPGPAVLNRALAAEPLDIGPERELLWDTPQYRRLFSAGEPDGHGMPGDAVYVWIAGESTMVTALRRYLVRDCGLDRGQVAFMGYWKHGVAQH
ncbi:siderophore-interacting protein [Sinomonas sp. B1-1]|uniref:siderophore-interacting protein n=1 Tax=Sinomonas sp. B1-1 TaxID=3141454 RepID=UPI003D2ACC1B